jgi:hypothetical protein
MSLNPDEHRLRFKLFTTDPMTGVGDALDKAHDILRLLRELHPKLVQGVELYKDRKTPDYPPLEPDFANLNEQVLTEEGRSWRKIYTKLTLPPDPNGALRADQPLVKSFNFSLGHPGSNRKPEFLHLDFDAGPSKPDMPGGTFVFRADLPLGPEPEFTDGAFLRHLMQTLILANPLTEFARMGNRAINRGTTGGGGYGIDIGWLTYSDEPELATHFPPEIQATAFAKGWLLDLQEEPPFGDVSALVAKALRVRETLIPGERLVLKRLRGLGCSLPYDDLDAIRRATPPSAASGEVPATA